MDNKSAQMMLLLEIISPSITNLFYEPDDSLSQEERDGIRELWEEHKPWNEVFGVVKDNDKKARLIGLFEELDQ